MAKKRATNNTRTKPFHKGRFDTEAERGKHRGWIVGAFMEQGPRKTELLEIKYWHKPKEHEIKTSCTFECTMILSGKVVGKVAGRRITLSAGQYVVIPPGVPNGIPQKILAKPVRGLTIKAPSIHVAKHEVICCDKRGKVALLSGKLSWGSNLKAR